MSTLRITDVSRDLPKLNQELSRLDSLDEQLKLLRRDLDYLTQLLRTVTTLPLP